MSQWLKENYGDHVLYHRIDESKRQFYQLFLSIKTQFQQISHKKIVHNIISEFIRVDINLRLFLEGIDNNNMEKICKHLNQYPLLRGIELDLSQNELKCQQLEILYNGMKKIIRTNKNLVKLGLNLNENTLSEEEPEKVSQLYFKYFKVTQQLQNLKTFKFLVGLNGFQELEFMPEECEESIAKGVKYLPTSLENFELDFREYVGDTGFSENDQTKNVGKIITDLPKGLKSLVLNFEQNQFGEILEQFAPIVNGLKKLPPQLENLDLNLKNTNFREYTENSDLLGQTFKTFPKTIKKLKLNLSWNILEGDDVQALFKHFTSLSEGLETLILDLSESCLEDCFEEFLNCIKYLPRKLKFLELSFGQNGIGLNEQDLQNFGQGISDLPPNLDTLSLDMFSNSLDYIKENIEDLCIGLSKIPVGQMKNLKLNIDKSFKNFDYELGQKIVSAIPDNVENIEILFKQQRKGIEIQEEVINKLQQQYQEKVKFVFL